MKISEQLRHFHLHDGGIDQIDYQPDLKQLTFKIRLCEWYGESGPGSFHSHSGIMTFFDVERFKAEPPLEQMVLSEDISLDILDFWHKPELDTSEREGVWILLDVDRRFPISKMQEIMIMEFVAFHFTWTPNS